MKGIGIKILCVMLLCATISTCFGIGTGSFFQFSQEIYVPVQRLTTFATNAFEFLYDEPTTFDEHDKIIVFRHFFDDRTVFIDIAKKDHGVFNVFFFNYAVIYSSDSRVTDVHQFNLWESGLIEQLKFKFTNSVGTILYEQNPTATVYSIKCIYREYLEKYYSDSSVDGWKASYIGAFGPKDDPLDN